MYKTEEEPEQQNQEKKDQKIMCPECGKDFRDMRGLTSHTRHIHDLDKNQLENLLKDKSTNYQSIIGGIGVALLTILTLGKFR